MLYVINVSQDATWSVILGQSENELHCAVG